MSRLPKLIENWHTELLRLWSIRFTLGLAALSGLYAAWPAFQDTINPVAFAAMSMAMSVAIIGARLVKQPGAPDVDV